MIEVKGQGLLSHDDVIFLKYSVNEYMFFKDDDFKNLKNFVRAQEGLNDPVGFNDLVNEKRKDFVSTKVQFDALVHLMIVNKVSFADILASEAKANGEAYVEKIKALIMDSMDMHIESNKKQVNFLLSVKLDSKTKDAKAVENLLLSQISMMESLKDMCVCEFEALNEGDVPF